LTSGHSDAQSGNSWRQTINEQLTWLHAASQPPVYPLCPAVDQSATNNQSQQTYNDGKKSSAYNNNRVSD